MELLVVIAIIGILAGGIVTVVDPLTRLQKARDAQRKSDLRQIQRALEIFHNDTNTYPSSLTFGASWTPYMGQVPEDPSTGRNYAYSRPDTQTYYLYASLERGDDAQACGGACPNVGALSCGAGLQCNYGATSTNTSP